MSTKIDVVYIGNEQDGIVYLNVLKQESNLKLIITEKEKTRGRNRKIAVMSPIQQFGLEHQIPVLAGNFRDDANLFSLMAQKIQQANVHIAIIFGFGRLIPEFVLQQTQIPWLNIHPSRLPKYRGASPIISTLLAGDSSTGISIQKVNKHLDSGNIVEMLSEPIFQTDTIAELKTRLHQRGQQILSCALQSFAKTGKILGQPQNEEQATYCQKINKKDGIICWAAPAQTILNKLRAFAIWPKSRTSLQNREFIIHKMKLVNQNVQAPPGTILRFEKNNIWIQSGNAVLNIMLIQPCNKNVLTTSMFVNGYTWNIGDCLD